MHQTWWNVDNQLLKLYTHTFADHTFRDRTLIWLDRPRISFMSMYQEVPTSPLFQNITSHAHGAFNEPQGIGFVWGCISGGPAIP